MAVLSVAVYVVGVARILGGFDDQSVAESRHHQGKHKRSKRSW
eukprot:CAMPEP_0197060382 /NCGR_PEP_ID=MMETSP1384-20130603/126735_1 /TAXON_ID=29189 /ORGANISM="Ammonia sp." /LENGTH=42 /DNA_ID= /DNA_START= /DNA_END= /DNA_ORIENTATION=